MAGRSPSRWKVTITRVRSSRLDRKSTRLNSSHANISYAVFCLKKKNFPRLGGRDNCTQRVAFGKRAAPNRRWLGGRAGDVARVDNRQSASWGTALGAVH